MSSLFGKIFWKKFIEPTFLPQFPVLAHTGVAGAVARRNCCLLVGEEHAVTDVCPARRSGNRLEGRPAIQFAIDFHAPMTAERSRFF